MNGLIRAVNTGNNCCVRCVFRVIVPVSRACVLPGSEEADLISDVQALHGHMERRPLRSNITELTRVGLCEKWSEPFGLGLLGRTGKFRTESVELSVSHLERNVVRVMTS